RIDERRSCRTLQHRLRQAVQILVTPEPAHRDEARVSGGGARELADPHASETLGAHHAVGHEEDVRAAMRGVLEQERRDDDGQDLIVAVFDDDRLLQRDLLLSLAEHERDAEEMLRVVERRPGLAGGDLERVERVRLRRPLALPASGLAGGTGGSAGRSLRTVGRHRGLNPRCGARAAVVWRDVDAAEVGDHVTGHDGRTAIAGRAAVVVAAVDGCFGRTEEADAVRTVGRAREVRRATRILALHRVLAVTTQRRVERVARIRRAAARRRTTALWSRRIARLPARAVRITRLTLLTTGGRTRNRERRCAAEVGILRITGVVGGTTDGPAVDGKAGRTLRSGEKQPGNDERQRQYELLHRCLLVMWFRFRTRTATRTRSSRV